MTDQDPLVEIAKTLASLETEAKGINRRLDNFDRHFDKLNSSQDKQWSSINKNQVTLGKVMERTHLSPCNSLNRHCDDEGAHGAQEAKISGRAIIIAATLALIGSLGSGFIGGLIQAAIH